MVNLSKIQKIKESKPFRLADIIVFVAAFVLLAGLLFWIFRSENEGKGVEVYYMGDLYATYSLTFERQEINIKDKLTLVIENNEVWVIDADCPDKVCEHHNKIRFTGQTITCSPNRIIIRITGNDPFDIHT